MKISLHKKNEETLAVKFLFFDPDGVKKIKQLPGRRWVPEYSVWSLPYTLGTIDQFLFLFKDYDIQIEPELLEECELLRTWQRSFLELSLPPIWNHEQETRLRNELVLRGYSSKTIKAYCGQVERFFGYIHKQRVPWNEQTVHGYSLYLLARECSHAYVNQAISAIKFYIQTVLGQKESAPYVRPKKRINFLPSYL